MTIVNLNTLLLIGMLAAVAVGVLFAENVGMINIGVEGQLAAGIFGYTLFGFVTQGWGDAGGHALIQFVRFALSLVVAWFFVLIATGLFAFFTIELRMDQILVGIAFNIILSAIASFVVYAVGNGDPFNLGTSNEFVGYRTSIFFVVTAVLLLFALLPLVYLFFLKTKAGVRIRAVGLNAAATKNSGVDLDYYRYLSLFLGTFFVTAGALFFVQYRGAFSGSAEGFGYLGLAILILSNRRLPMIAFFSCLLAVIYSAALDLGEVQKTGFLDDNKAAFGELLLSLNYIIPLFALIGYGAYKRRCQQRKKAPALKAAPAQRAKLIRKVP